MKKVVIFDVDGTIADVEHRRHFVNGNNDWDSFRKETVNDTPVQWVCDIAKRHITKVTKLHSSLQEMNPKETSLKDKFLSGLETDTKVSSSDLTEITDVMQSSNQNLQIDLKISVDKLTSFMTTEIKWLICGDKEEPLLFKLRWRFLVKDCG